MYCPRCASTAIEGQRFCKSCGMNLGVILDALDGKRGPLDFELLKRDLRELGSNLRSGFEGATSALRGTSRYSQPVPTTPQSGISLQDLSREVERALRNVEVAHSRKYSLQKAALALFNGAAIVGAWAFLLNKFTTSGLAESIERIILVESGHEVVGLVMMIRYLWVLGLIPIATGVAHLFNGIFLAPRKEKSLAPSPGYDAPPPLPQILPEPQSAPPAPASVIEDPTLRLALRLEKDR